jgi:hypothetical protein
MDNRMRELTDEGLTIDEAATWHDTPFSAKDILYYIEGGITSPDQLPEGE